jgi:hypothetical protein
MTPTTARTAVRGQRTQTKDNIRHRPLSRLGVVRQDGIREARRAPSRGAAPMFSLLLPSYCQMNPKPTEEAMPDPDAGPSHRPGARTPRRHVLN